MIYPEPPIMIVFVALLLGVTLMTNDNTGDRGRYRLFHEIAETTKELKLTHTCDNSGFITTQAKPNCAEKNGFRYLNTGTSTAFFRMDANSVPHPLWTASLNPYSTQIRVSLQDLRTIHSAFVEGEHHGTR